jgi:hypothetical protein
MAMAKVTPGIRMFLPRAHARAYSTGGEGLCMPSFYWAGAHCDKSELERTDGL